MRDIAGPYRGLRKDQNDRPGVKITQRFSLFIGIVRVVFHDFDATKILHRREPSRIAARVSAESHYFVRVPPTYPVNVMTENAITFATSEARGF